ncbi:Exodeoxyribonuclease 7 large subunit [Candidatus Zixiibacteriota bacterium]|nr:Exodeoxyribonuclease 7 large subunit [candidate division Zixibacteria bacterium]
MEMKNSDEKVFTVTAITRLIKYTLEETFPSVWVEGEISNYLHHSSGHRYFSLKDENAAIKCTIWRSAGQYLKFAPEDGMKVRAFGDITVYEKGGNYQLNVKRLQTVGVGELEVAFRQLYEKLSEEGLFDESLKISIPNYPLKIGLVTSPTGAAIRDIINIGLRRNDSVQLIIYPARVQGEGAAESLIAGIEYFNRREDIDVIIIGRGGGSLEDLWAFNEEALVRAVAGSELPIVSAVGHEIDTTLSDLAADLRAPTPSAAAELVIWEKSAFLEQLKISVARLGEYLSGTAEAGRERLRYFMSRPVFMTPESVVRQREQYLDHLKKEFQTAGRIVLEKEKNALSFLLSRLESLSPLAVLNRGYAVLKNLASGKSVKSIKELKPDDRIEATLKDGTAVAIIKETEIK